MLLERRIARYANQYVPTDLSRHTFGMVLILASGGCRHKQRAIIIIIITLFIIGFIPLYFMYNVDKNIIISSLARHYASYIHRFPDITYI